MSIAIKLPIRIDNVKSVQTYNYFVEAIQYLISKTCSNFGEMIKTAKDAVDYLCNDMSGKEQLHYTLYPHLTINQFKDQLYSDIIEDFNNDYDFLI